MNIHQIQEASRGGFASISTDTGQLTTKGQTFGGKVVEWFRAKLHPGTVAKENSAVMNAFIRAIGSDPSYGASYANMAARELAPQLQGGKRLTERRISTVLDHLNADKAQNKSLNALTAQRFSSYDIHGDPNCFGSIWANAAHEHNLPFEASKMNTSTLEYNIQRDIKKAGQDGKHLVTIDEAKAIATERINASVNVASKILAGIKKEAASEGEAASLTDRLCTTSISPQSTAAGFITQARIEEKLGGEFDLTLSRMAKERGMEDMIPDFFTKKVKQSINYSVQSDGVHSVPAKQIQDVVEQKLAKFLDGKQRAATALDSLDLSPDSRARMRKLIADRPSLKDAQHVEQAAVVADLFDNLTDTLVTGAPSDVKAALNTFQKEFMNAFEPLKDETSSANDFIPLMSNGFTIWKEQRSDSEHLQTTIDGIMNTIEGPTGQSVISELEERAQTDEQAIYDMATMNNLFDQIRNSLTDVDFSQTNRE